MPAPLAPLSDDARFELAMRAAARERRNRPRHLTYVGVAVLLVALVSLWMARSSLAGARASLASARAQALEAERLVTRLAELRDTGPDNPGGGGEPTESVRTVLQGIATELGLQDTIPSPVEPPPKPVMGGNQLEHEHTYREIRSPKVQPVLEWVKRALDRMPDLNLSSIGLKPTPAGWTISVSFKRVVGREGESSP